MSINNRWFQLCASLVAMIMIANLQYSWTLFVQPLQQSNGWRLSDIQWAFTLFVLCQTWVMPMEGWLIDRLGSRPRFSGVDICYLSLSLRPLGVCQRLRQGVSQGLRIGRRD